jgi:hypothetical protein
MRHSKPVQSMSVRLLTSPLAALRLERGSRAVGSRLHSPARAVSLVSAVSLAAALLGGLAPLGCGDAGEPYQPIVPPAGVKASLPAVPNVPSRPIKEGDAYTVWGASYHLRSRVHHNDVAGRDIKITGYIIKTNLAEAPKCAIHATGKEDPEGCQAPIPTFWLADTKDANEKDAIKVLGWASNYAQLFDAVKDYRKRRASKKVDAERLMDNFWGVKLPYPLPGPGAKVTVTGNYSTAFTRATSGTESDPIMGVLTYDDIQYQEEPAELATLPGIRP